VATEAEVYYKQAPVVRTIIQAFVEEM